MISFISNKLSIWINHSHSMIWYDMIWFDMICFYGGLITLFIISYHLRNLHGYSLHYCMGYQKWHRVVCHHDDRVNRYHNINSDPLSLRLLCIYVYYALEIKSGTGLQYDCRRYCGHFFKRHIWVINFKVTFHQCNYEIYTSPYRDI